MKSSRKLKDFLYFLRPDMLVCDGSVHPPWICLLWNSIHTGEMAAFWLFVLLYFLFYTFTSPHPTLLSIFSNWFLVLQNSDCFVIFFFICLPISAYNPESICREMQLNSWERSPLHTHSLPLPRFRIKKLRNTTVKIRKEPKPARLTA